MTTSVPPFVLAPNVNDTYTNKHLNKPGADGVSMHNGIEIKIVKTIAEKRNFLPVF